MLSIGKLTAAQGFDYLLRGVAHGAEDYYARDEQVGEAPGRWVASSDALLGLTGEVRDEAFRSVYGEHADPRSGETLGRTRRVYRSVAERLAEVRAQLEGAAAREGRAVEPEEWAAAERRIRRADRTSVDAYDLAFSPVKSVSVLWAAGGRRVRREVWAAHHAAVDEALRVLEREAVFTRSGHHGTRPDDRRRDRVAGGRWEDAGGLVGARFDHRMSRAGDPQIHSHVVVLNMSRTDRDGRWRALDGQAIYRARGLGSITYEQVLMTELSRRLGVQWRLRGDGKAWEIDGISERLRERFSTRRVQVSAQLRPLVDAYRERSIRVSTGAVLARGRNQRVRLRGHSPTGSATAWRTGSTRLNRRRDRRALAGEPHCAPACLVRLAAACRLFLPFRYRRTLPQRRPSWSANRSST